MKDYKDKRIAGKAKPNRKLAVKKSRDFKKPLRLLAFPFVLPFRLWTLLRRRRQQSAANCAIASGEPRDWSKILHRALTAGVVTVGTVLVIGGTLILWELVSDSRFFSVESIRVENQAMVSAEEVRDLSDVVPGLSIFDLDLELIGRKIAENPWIAEARVERVFPREVVIRVREHVPAAIANLGCLYYVDGDGVVFKPLAAGDRIDYPLVSGLDRQFLLDQPQEAGALLKEGMTLLQELQRRTVFGVNQISEIHLDANEGIDIYTLVSGVPIRMGHGNFAEKLDRLERVYTELVPRLAVLQYIDLNVVDRVIVKVDSSLTLAPEGNPGGRGRT